MPTCKNQPPVPMVTSLNWRTYISNDTKIKPFEGRATERHQPNTLWINFPPPTSDSDGWAFELIWISEVHYCFCNRSADILSLSNSKPKWPPYSQVIQNGTAKLPFRLSNADLSMACVHFPRRNDSLCERMRYRSNGNHSSSKVQLDSVQFSLWNSCTNIWMQDSSDAEKGFVFTKWAHTGQDNLSADSFSKPQPTLAKHPSPNEQDKMHWNTTPQHLFDFHMNHYFGRFEWVENENHTATSGTNWRLVRRSKRAVSRVNKNARKRSNAPDNLLRNLNNTTPSTMTTRKTNSPNNRSLCSVIPRNNFMTASSEFWISSSKPDNWVKKLNQ